MVMDCDPTVERLMYMCGGYAMTEENLGDVQSTMRTHRCYLAVLAVSGRSARERSG